MSRAELLKEQEALLSKYGQYKEMDLQLNMTRGIPSKEQLELSMPMLDTINSTSNLVTKDGTDLRNYGGVDGISEAKKFFADILDVSTEEIIVGGNSSLTMMFDTISSAMGHGLLGGTPWANQGKVKFLCPCPGYDRHFSITNYFGIEMIPIEYIDGQPDMDTIEKLVNSDEKVKGIWCVPKYSNPTGITYSDETVRRFARLRPAAEDFRIFWDNAYFVHNLFGEDTKLLNLLEECKKEGNPNMVYMYFSTSKITFPGAGLAGMATSVTNAEAIKKRIAVQSIGPDKINQYRHIAFINNSGGIYAQMERHSEILRPRFTAVAKALDENLTQSGVASWSNPNGGYFVNFNAMIGCAKKIVSMCKEAGVVLTNAGASFPYGNDPEDKNIRIAPTSPSVEELIKAIEILAVCTKLTAIEQLLKNS
jgi:DNA-binding transcriptional MocR family regulator